MKDRMIITQLRATIFAPLNIGFTQENYVTFRDLLLSDAKALNANPPEMVVPGMNPNIPQYGMPWRLFKKCGEEGEYNIVFLPGKIDIILAKDVNYGDAIEQTFCNKCVDWFTKILSKQAEAKVSRIAYAPTFAIKLEDITAETVWGRLLKETMIDGTVMQDVNLNFLLKRPVIFGDKEVQMNLLYNFTDGVQIKPNAEGGQTLKKVVLFQLDLNSIPEAPLTLDARGVKDFYDAILETKNQLVDYVAR